MDDVVVVIPARYASSRFPGKPLAPVAGKPLVVHALGIARAVESAGRVLVATDDERIASVVRAEGAEVVMTDPALASGTDRAWAAVAGIESEIVVNLQVDEPLLPASVLDALAARLADDPACAVATPVVSVPRAAAASADVVTVAGEAGVARYFSRSVVPWGADPVWRHIGVYAYRREALRRFVEAGPGALESVERLEQLRALALGMPIGLVEVEAVSCAVDRPADVAVAERLLALPAGAGHQDGEAPMGRVRLVVLDVDGVLTDGRITYLGDLGQMVSFDVKDGQGLVDLRGAGIEVALISARDSPALRRRAEELGITEVRVLVADKAAEVVDVARSLSVDLGDVCFVGDDVGDLAAMALCGTSAAPGDGVEEVRRRATLVLDRPGGRGAVRELADILLAASTLGTGR